MDEEGREVYSIQCRQAERERERDTHTLHVNVEVYMVDVGVHIWHTIHMSRIQGSFGQGKGYF